MLNGAESRTTPKRNHRAVQRIPGAGIAELSIHLGPAGQDLLLSRVVWMSPWAHGAGRTGNLWKKVWSSCFQQRLFSRVFFSPFGKNQGIWEAYCTCQRSLHARGAQLTPKVMVLHMAENKIKKIKKNQQKKILQLHKASVWQREKLLHHQPWKYSESLVISSGQGCVRRSTDGYCALSPAIRAAAPELQREHNPGAGALHVLYCHI